jgi:hypothetical protein
MYRFRIFAALSLVIAEVMCLACNRQDAAPKLALHEDTATINLSAVTNSEQIQVFYEVKHANQLPNAVLDALSGITDHGQPFNATDVIDPSLSRKSLVAAAVSEKYCIVSYWAGGISLGFETAIFELSEKKAKRIWVSRGQGGLSFRDLKEMVESGRMHNDLDRQDNHRLAK